MSNTYRSNDIEVSAYIQCLGDEWYFLMIVRDVNDDGEYNYTHLPSCFYNQTIHKRHNNNDAVTRKCVSVIVGFMIKYDIWFEANSRIVQTKRERINDVLNELGTDDAGRARITESQRYKSLLVSKPLELFNVSWNVDDVSQTIVNKVRSYVVDELTRYFQSVEWPSMTLTDRCLTALERDNTMKRYDEYINRIVSSIARRRQRDND